MATTPTQLPVPSESPRDLKFNAGKIDEFVTSMQREYEDRFGNKHYTIEGLRWIAQQAIAKFGYINVDSFEDGATLTLPNEILRWESNGEYYRWDGVLPKVVASGSSPETTGGIGVGAWLLIPMGATDFDSVDVVETSNIPTGVTYISVDGYYSAGDGGAANYKKVDSEPTHPGKIQSADGAWWEFVGIEINLYQTGCRGDSTSGVTGSGTDDTLSFMKARDVALALGIPVIIPALPKTKAFRLTAMISHSDTVSYIGSGAHVTSGLVQNYPNGGSWIYFDHLDEGFRFRDETTPSNSKKFARIEGAGIDRNQDAPTSAWIPSLASYDLRVEYNVELDDVIFLKSSKIALIRSGGMLQTQRIRGQPLIVGFECERSADVQRWAGDHWWPYWSQDTNVITYTKVNAFCYKVQRADGLMIDNAFGIFYKRLFYAVDAVGAGSGLANFHLRNPYADIGGGGIEIVSNNYSAYGTIEGYLCNSDVAGAPSEGAAFKLTGTVPSQIKLGMRSNRSPSDAVYVAGTTHHVTLTATRLAGWSFVEAGRAAISARDGAVITLLHVPEMTTGNGLYYSADATSSIIFPVNYHLGGSTASPQGFFSRRVTIADNNVAIVPAPAGDFTVNMHFTPVAQPGSGNPSGSVWLRANASPASAIINLSHTTNVAVTTGILNGTTGATGNLTISAASNGSCYIENRTGSSKSFIITMLGN
ncbi:tail fiber/spike domain-containing protein [Yersinia aleksiciae]|uniref:tail fiber/spike domain-containing protein n=1 Tax=Yersinia aleksiciae TaxID=263819 RepID=UPI001643A6F4|nr:hypothetical protein [Yersinia aleksiciae]